MKKFNWVKLSSGILFFGIACVVANAGQESCLSDFTHCAYSTDTPNGLAGNWMQVTQNGRSGKFCMTYGGGASINPTMIKQFNIPMGSHTWQFNVCKDEGCSVNTLVLNDKFTLSFDQKTQQYTAQPSYQTFTFQNIYTPVTCPRVLKNVPLK